MCYNSENNHMECAFGWAVTSLPMFFRSKSQKLKESGVSPAPPSKVHWPRAALKSTHNSLQKGGGARQRLQWPQPQKYFLFLSKWGKKVSQYVCIGLSADGRRLLVWYELGGSVAWSFSGVSSLNLLCFLPRSSEWATELNPQCCTIFILRRAVKDTSQSVCVRKVLWRSWNFTLTVALL